MIKSMKKILKTLPGREPATFRLVAQCLNRVPIERSVFVIIDIGLMQECRVFGVSASIFFAICEPAFFTETSKNS
jgi:hypothetical protein